MNIFFPNLNVALVVRRKAPKNGRLVTSWEGHSVYLIETSKRPKGCLVADRLLGGWNYPSGECISLVYARSLRSLYHYCARDVADKLVHTKRLENGLFVNLVRTRTRMFFSIGCTAISAEEALAEDSE